MTSVLVANTIFICMWIMYFLALSMGLKSGLTLPATILALHVITNAILLRRK